MSLNTPTRILTRLLGKCTKPSGHSRKRNAGLLVEPLEERAVPTGTWTTLANLFPSSGADTMMLLSDGTVMVHGGAGFASSAWYRLTPDSSGSYIQGTWSALPAMQTARYAFTSDLLPDGRVLVMGGEYSGPNTELNALNTGEIYDPVANTWTSIADFPLSHFGDDPTEVLPDGRVLGGYYYGPETYVYDPASNSWTATGSKLRGDISDEESWVKLPDDSILSYDIFSSIWTGTGHAQRYVPSQGKWVDAGTLPVLLSSFDDGAELGPALLLPDGRALFLGANGNSAFYTPPVNPTDPGSWEAGPPIPNHLTSNDAPGAMLPNGDVLFEASPPDAGPTTIFEFNPVTNTYTDVTPRNGFPLRAGTMLVLPTGQIMVTNETRRIDVFTPDGSPNVAWQPTITTITDNGNKVFTLTGTQLNGISEGAAFGDDAEMASNYPIVRFIDASGTVSYARTFNWSSTGVATGSTPESVNFTLPAGAMPGAYLVSVIANGIASSPVLAVLMGADQSNLVLRVDPNDTAQVQIWNSDTVLGTFPIRSFSSILVTGSNTDNTVVLESIPSGVPVTVNEGSGKDSIILGNVSLDTIQGPLTFHGSAGNGAGLTTLVLNDQSFAGVRTFTVTDSTLRWGESMLTYSGLGSITINGGSGGNTFNVLAASAAGVTLVGGGDGDLLVGSNAGNTFTLAGNNAGTLGGSAYRSSVRFSQIGNLAAGTGGDTFVMVNGASLTGSITGGGSDTLDYSDYTSSVIVDLQTGFATGIGSGVSGITTVFGGGSKTPAPSGVYNLLIGNGGSTLYGGFRRPNLLIAGSSASLLTGNFLRDDLLIGGSTAYDTEEGLSTWRQIAAYWASNADDYATRVANLTSGNGVPLLDASVVRGNGGGNTMIGGGELALLYTEGMDTIAGFDTRSQQVMIAP